MIDSVTVTNARGESVTIELKSPEKSGFFIRDAGIEGLGPPDATISSTPNGSTAGDEFNSTRVEKRSIVFNLGFLFNPTVEAMRRATYKYFPVGEKIKMRFISDTRVGDIYGYVESNKPTIFSKDEGCVISVICHDPFFYAPDLQITSMSVTSASFQFPLVNNSLNSNLLQFGTFQPIGRKSLFYDGEGKVGIVIRINAIGGSAWDFRMLKDGDPKLFVITPNLVGGIEGQDTSRIQSGDTVTISTLQGNKTVKLLRNAIEYNWLYTLERDPSWFMLDKGENVFMYDATAGDDHLVVSIENRVAYEGM
jgi:hypothetical protein